jgi:hypothetical protein
MTPAERIHAAHRWETNQFRNGTCEDRGRTVVLGQCRIADIPAEGRNKTSTGAQIEQDISASSSTPDILDSVKAGTGGGWLGQIAVSDRVRIGSLEPPATRRPHVERGERTSSSHCTTF